MADFARILAAVDKVLDTDGLGRYTDRAGTLATDALSADPFITAMAEQYTGGSFVGSAAELLGKVIAPDDRRPPKGWPPTARAVTTLLKRQAPVMRAAGWTVTDQPAGHDNVVRWSLTPPRRSDLVGISSSQPSQPSQQGDLSGNVGGPTVDTDAWQDGRVTLCVMVDCWEPTAGDSQFCSQHPAGEATTTAPSRSGYQRSRPRPAAS